MFNLRLPPNATKVVVLGVHVGYAWPCKSPLVRVNPSMRKVAKKYDRWAACMLDGTMATTTSRTRPEAIRKLRRLIAKKVAIKGCSAAK